MMVSLLKQPLFLFRRRRRSLSLSSSSSATQKRKMMFQLQHDPLTGKSEWLVIEDQEDETANKKALLGTTSYLDMLNDTRRNSAYRQAIEKTITAPCHVLDIGCGTGLLSMMAARAMGDGGMVTACESYLPMLKLTRKVLRANAMDKKNKNIRVINKRSDELEVGVDMPSRAHLLVTEILDSELLGEGLIPTLQHAHDNLLLQNPLTVPYRATTYAQLVECTYFKDMHDLVNKEAQVSDAIHLVPNLMPHLLCVNKKQFAMHCDAIEKDCKLLSEPFKVFDFDFWRRPESFRETGLHIKATNDGTVHAIISWWLLQLDSEGTIFYSTEPTWVGDHSDVKELQSSSHSSENWCDHWKQSVWLTPSSGLSVSKDEEIQLLAVHTETSISYKFKTSNFEKVAEHRDLSTPDCQIILSPERNALYGNSFWRCLMLNATQNALHQRVSPLCLVADDSLFLTVAVAHLSKTSHVIPSFPGLGKKGSQYLKTVAAANSYHMDQIKFFKKRDLQLIEQDSHQRKINLFVAEPFYYGNDSVLPWHNLRFWKDRTLLHSIMSEDVLVMPCRGLLRACAVYLPDLWRSRCCLKDIEGFDHSMVNTTLGACGDLPATEDSPFLPFFLWQCGKSKILSEIATILELDFSKPMSPCSGKTEVLSPDYVEEVHDFKTFLGLLHYIPTCLQLQIRESGLCHGFVLWIDWVMDVENTTIVSTGPDKRYWKQAVKLLSKPVEVRVGDLSSTEIKASFEPSTGDLIMQHAFL